MSNSSASSAASKEQLREARLRALGLTTDGNSPQETKEEPEQKRQMTHRTITLNEVQFQVLRALMFPAYAADDDIQRWHSQGFV